MSRFVALVLLGVAYMRGSDCGQGLSAQQKLEKFKELDRQAEQAVQSHRSSDAVALYREAACLDPNSPRAFYGLGIAQAASGDFLNARDSFKTADRLEPKTPMPLIMQVRVNFSLRDIDSLKANLREVEERFPLDTQAHDTLARLLAERNLLVLALAESLRSRRSGGAGDPNSRIQLAILENTVGAYEDAIQNAIAVDRNPQLPGEIRAAAAGVAGLSYESLDQPQSAERYLKKAIALDPTRDNSYLALADLFEQSQRYSEAVDVLQAGRRNVPQSLSILLPLGADLVRAEHYQAGIDVLHELLKASPAVAEAYISIADASHKLGSTEQELAALGKLAQIKPDYPMIHVLMARALLTAAPIDYPKVLAELSLAENAAPVDPDIFYLKGKAYFALGKYDEAVAAFRRSIELKPSDPGPYYQLAKTYQKLGKTELAQQQFERLKYLDSASVKQ